VPGSAEGNGRQRCTSDYEMQPELMPINCLSVPANPRCCKVTRTECEDVLPTVPVSKRVGTDIGSYEVRVSQLAVTVDPLPQGTPLCLLPFGAVVEVVEMLEHRDTLAISARIAAPAGWISLREADGHWQCWVGDPPEGSTPRHAGDNPNAVLLAKIGQLRQGIIANSPRCHQELSREQGSNSTDQLLPPELSLQDQPMQDRPPQMLHVRSPNGQHSCAGIYHLCLEETPNGHPCWSRQDESRWLYSSRSGRWCIGGGDVRSERFSRSAGFLSSISSHEGCMPHTSHLTWQRWDGSSFVRDDEITINIWEVALKQDAWNWIPDDDIVQKFFSQQLISGLENTGTAPPRALVVRGNTVDSHSSEPTVTYVMGEASPTAHLGPAAVAAVATTVAPGAGVSCSQLPQASLLQQQGQPEQLQQRQPLQQPHGGFIESPKPGFLTEQQQQQQQQQQQLQAQALEAISSTFELAEASDAASVVPKAEVSHRELSRASLQKSQGQPEQLQQLQLQVPQQQQPLCDMTESPTMGLGTAQQRTQSQEGISSPEVAVAAVATDAASVELSRSSPQHQWHPEPKKPQPHGAVQRRTAVEVSPTVGLGSEQLHLQSQQMTGTTELALCPSASGTNCSMHISTCTMLACSRADAELLDSQKVLRVVSPTQPSCGGFYDLVVGTEPNGKPLWRMRGGCRWIYTGTDGRWYIGGTLSKRRQFRCESGYIYHNTRGYASPVMLQGPWSRGDSKAWHADPSIKVRQAIESELLEAPMSSDPIATHDSMYRDSSMKDLGFSRHGAMEESASLLTQCHSAPSLGSSVTGPGATCHKDCGRPRWNSSMKDLDCSRLSASEDSASAPTHCHSACSVSSSVPTSQEATCHNSCGQPRWDSRIKDLDFSRRCASEDSASVLTHCHSARSVSSCVTRPEEKCHKNCGLPRWNS